MEPREQDNDALLLVLVLLICATLAGILEIGESRPTAAASSNIVVPTVLASDQPVRVILPFTPNTTPRER